MMEAIDRLIGDLEKLAREEASAIRRKDFLYLNRIQGLKRSLVGALMLAEGSREGYEKRIDRLLEVFEENMEVLRGVNVDMEDKREEAEAVLSNLSKVKRAYVGMEESRYQALA